MGIDIGTGEMVLADRLREKGKRLMRSSAITRKVTRTPNFYQGDACPGDPDAAGRHLDQRRRGHGVARIREVHNAIAASNHEQPVDAAQLLEMPLMCLHQPADILFQRSSRS